MSKFEKIARKIFLKAEMPEMQKYEINMEMVNDSVVRMDMDSFRKSKAVQAQAAAAKIMLRRYYENS